MAKLLAFTIYDSKSAAHFQPQFFTTTGIAIRAFSDAVINTEHPFGKHPEDYSLVHVGEFDDQTGHMKPAPQNQVVSTALELKAQLEEKARLKQEAAQEWTDKAIEEETAK